MEWTAFRNIFGGIVSIHKPYHYDLLPTVDDATDGSVSIAQRRFSLRRNPCAFLTRIFFSAAFRRSSLVFLLLVTCVIGWLVPPSYDDVRSFEQHLPQHQIPADSIGDRRYLRFEGTLWGLGLNNILQEELLLSYIAYATNRSFVFSDYTWSHTPLPFTIDDYSLRPARMPLNAFISGPTAGGPMSASYSQHTLELPVDSHARTNTDLRAVHLAYFDAVCPQNKRVRLTSADDPRLSDDTLDGNELLATWVDWLSRDEMINEPCVVVDFSERVVFDHLLFGSTRVISMFPVLASSPILKKFAWSYLVEAAVERNMNGLINPVSSSSPNLMSGVVAVHLRRGDYSGHCLYLSKHGTAYQGMNQYPGIVDRFDPSTPPPDSDSYHHYLPHCLPTIPEIVERLCIIRAENPHLSLTKVYLLSNGRRWWLDELWAELRADGWSPVREGLGSSQDLSLTREEQYVSGAVDMAIAEKAEVFVGNGFSSLTGNIVMLRLAKGVDVGLNRML
ncbi:hypothetical protein EDD18DRAFT_207437 [Armillaria luteobubalina]|uniref:Uncharacterized protein n=1 Tax=Armillaria luteobubalina TaxID=153913 RepID=A0AA39Q5M9_9AGAR|nr:hypothetical protein EDD18DRAFT_207437 [Armillaria luteobubalina]